MHVMYVCMYVQITCRAICSIDTAHQVHRTCLRVCVRACAPASEGNALHSTSHRDPTLAPLTWKKEGRFMSSILRSSSALASAAANVEDSGPCVLSFALLLLVVLLALGSSV